MKKFSRIFKYIRKYSDKLTLYFVLTVLSTLFGVVSITMLMPFFNLIFKPDQPANAIMGDMKILSVINQYLVHVIQTDGRVAALTIICAFLIVLTLLKNLFLYLSNLIAAPIKSAVVTEMRKDMYNKILELPVGYFTEKRKGDIMSRMTNDIVEIEVSIVGAMEGLIKDPITIIGYLASLIIISPMLSLFLLILLPLTGFLIGRVSRKLKAQSQDASVRLGETLSIMDETLGGLRVIKAFMAEKLLSSRFFAVNDDLFRIRKKMNARRDLASPLTELLGVIVLSIILYFGGRLVLAGNDSLTAAGLLAYIASFGLILNPAKNISTSFFNIQRGAAAIERVEEILNAPVTVDDNPNGKQLASFNDSIELRNVSFAYDDAVILKNINLTIKKGKTVALVGSSGAGKSTLADLVPRFHDATGGEVLIDGINIKDYSLASVRQHISIVTQEPILFNDTIANNISLGSPNATKEEIINAATVANAHKFIVQKEEGYDTNIGDRGSKLSGGERQRLTIARAVLKNPPILILDEATSSLDTESERLVQDAINNMMQNRTSIVIAHRLSTIRHADEIIVLQKGEIVERGNHEELIALDGFYKKLVNMQEVK
jgi:subfamily B ATP-binding cassette protein MsbA